MNEHNGENQMEDMDAIVDALEQVKEKMMAYMTKTGQSSSEESAESPEMEMGEEMPDGDPMMDDEMPIEPEEKPKSSVLKRYDFAGKSPAPAPKAPPSMPGKFKKRR